MDEPLFASQLAQMRQEMMNSLGAELRGEIELLHQANYDLKQECRMLKEEQLRDQAKIFQLQGEVSALQTFVGKAERQAKYFEVVTKNKNWEYPQHVPNQDELLSLFYDEDESLEIVESIVDIQAACIKMRRGEKGYIVDPGGTPQYYQLLMPHYKEFADALIEYRHTIDCMDDETFCFSLGYAALPREVLDILQDALQHTHFHNLTFYRNEIHGVGVGYMNFITNCVTADTKLKCLDLDGVTFENTEDIDSFCAVVNNHDSLSLLSLRYCIMGRGGLREIFNKLKSQTLEEIAFCRNGILNLNPRDMSDFLLSNPSLSKLDFGRIPFSEQDIVYIADALRNNSSLRELVFRFEDHNVRHVVPGNWRLLSSVVFDQTSLNSAYDSNHYCHLDLEISAPSQTYPLSRINMYEDPTMNRRRKIYNILSSRNRNRENAAYFESDNTGIKHMPQILALLKPFSENYIDDDEDKDYDEVEPLSIAYEIMRDWKMPELYNYLDVMDED